MCHWKECCAGGMNPIRFPPAMITRQLMMSVCSSPRNAEMLGGLIGHPGHYAQLGSAIA